MSILFSDIRGFTSLSENMTPHENFQFINSYLKVMGPVIRKHHGFIDKYIGDAIMALFENDADNALQAAIAMLQALQSYNQERAKTKQPPIQIGIGINKGSLIMGTIGEDDRMESTVIGDAVNLASRLEGLTKQYQVLLLISESTYSSLKTASDFLIREIDHVQVKGKLKTTTIFEVFDADPPEQKKQKLKILPLFQEALALFYEQHYDEAQKLFEECAITAPTDPVTKKYIGRAKIGSNTPREYES